MQANPTIAENSIPRPEYPRPQFARHRWLNLNGTWGFRTDDDNSGLEQSWFSRPEIFDREILVPFSFECAMSGIADRSFHSCVWYRRSFVTPGEWKGHRVLVNFGAVDYRTIVWVNGIVVASHEGGHTPFYADISGALRAARADAEEHVIVVRAEDPATDRYIPRGKQYWREEPISIFYARTTGIWQTVWLEPVAGSYFDNVRITARIDGSVNIELSIVNPVPFQFVTATVLADGATIASGMSLADGPRAVIAAQVGDPKLWSPWDPNLYDVRLELHTPTGILDAVDKLLRFSFGNHAGRKGSAERRSCVS